MGSRKSKFNQTNTYLIKKLPKTKFDLINFSCILTLLFKTSKSDLKGLHRKTKPKPTKPKPNHPKPSWY